MTAIRSMTADDIAQVERIIDIETSAKPPETGAVRSERSDSRLIKTRFHKEPAGCFIAEDAAQGPIGAVLSITWGSVAWLGPLTVHPEFSGKGVEHQLLRAVLDYWEPMGL